MAEATFEPKGYLRFDLTAGQLSNRQARRHIVVPLEVVEAGDTAEHMREAARKWGGDEGKKIAALVRDPLTSPPERFLTPMAHMLATLGWGVSELESWGGVLFVKVANAPKGAAVELLAGFLEGVFSSISKEPFVCVPFVEGKDPRFLLLGKPGAAKVEGWARDRLEASEVVRRMLAGEHLAAGLAGGL